MIISAFFMTGISIFIYKLISIYKYKNNLKVTKLLQTAEAHKLKTGDNLMISKITKSFLSVILFNFTFIIIHLLWLLYCGLYFNNMGFYLILLLFISNVFNKKSEFFIKNNFYITLISNIIQLIGIIYILYLYVNN